MDFISKYRRQLALRSFLAVITPVIVLAVFWFLCSEIFSFEILFTLIISLSAGIAVAIISANVLTIKASEPLEKLQEIIMFTAHSERGGAAPDTAKLKLARDLVESLSREIYNLGSSSPTTIAAPATTSVNQPQQVTEQPATQIVIDAIPMPIIGMDTNQNVTVANKAVADYINKPLSEIIGKSLYDSVHLSFRSEEGLEEWLNKVKKSSVTSTRAWNRVRHAVSQDEWKQFDMVANFSSGNSTGTETMMAIFDRTEQYGADDNEISFVALAVHELRTPLTIMRGYIEVFSDELGSSLSPELKDFMHKMQASAEQLTAFVSNILNVARVEENQLELKLRSENISDIMQTAISDLELRARVHGKHIDLKIDENLPPVAADRISVHEVINNLVDNAIKYSDKADKVDVHAYMNNDGLVEISVRDYGIGIPTSVMGDLFQKFHRSHKSRIQVGGTGLGLYLSKAIVNAHGGNIWVRSKEGEGSEFNFTLIPFDQISAEQAEGEDGIIRGAHGWIKNHSLYRN